MVKVKNKTTEIIYWISIVLAVLIGFFFYGMYVEQFSSRFLLFFSGLPFFLFVMGSFGLIWPWIKPEGESTYIIHSIVVGVLFALLFFIHVWLILPLLCPDLGQCLRM